MTQKEKQLARISLRGDQVLELNLDKLPELPPSIMKMPGMAEWWAGVRLTETRNINALYRLASNIPPTTRSG